MDPKGRTLVLRSRNLCYNNLLVVEECCTYSANEEAPWESTNLKQDISIKSFTGWSHIRESIEDFCVNRFFANAHKGRIALENAIERIYAETKESVLEVIEDTKEQVIERLHAFAEEGAAPSVVVVEEKPTPENNRIHLD